MEIKKTKVENCEVCLNHLKANDEKFMVVRNIEINQNYKKKITHKEKKKV